MRKSRITVVERIYHQNFEDEPTPVEDGWQIESITKASVFPKKFDLGEAWTSLDSGWVDPLGCALLRIANQKPKRRTIPTPAEALDEASRIVEVSFSDPPASGGPILHPGESLRFRPSDVRTLRLRCRNGKARLVVHFFPGDGSTAPSPTV